MKTKKKNILFLFFTLIVTYFAILSLFLVYINQRVIDEEINDEKIKYDKVSVVIKYFLLENFTHTILDINFLKNIFTYESLNDKNHFTHIEHIFYNFIKSNNDYDQIRFIDSTGMEKVRVNRKQDSVEIVGQKNLQNKKDRYYFKSAFYNNDSNIYASKFDLNVEKDTIEIPYNPTIRFSIPVTNSKNKKIGVIVINMKGSHIISSIKEIETFTGASILLVNSDGYYIMGMKDKDEWGFMFNSKKDINVKMQFPKIEKELFLKDKGFVETKDYYFFFSQFSPKKSFNLIGEISDWKIIAYSSKYDMKKESSDIFNFWIITSSILSVIVAFVFYFLSKNIILKKEATESLITKQQELTKSNLELVEINNTKNKFFSIIAHDLKNPFNTLIGLSKMLSSKYTTDINKVKQYSSIINKTAESTYSLLENLLSWSQIQTHTLKPQLSLFTIEELITDVIDITEHSTKIKGINFQLAMINPENKKMKIFADKNMIETVIRNLLTNAIKFTPRNGKIILSIEVINSDLHVSVKDSGVGIKKENIEKLFSIDKKVQTDGTENEKGTGLGLNLCNEFITMHGGKISVRSILGKGSIFSFQLPISKNK